MEEGSDGRGDGRGDGVGDLLFAQPTRTQPCGPEPNRTIGCGELKTKVDRGEDSS